MKYDLLRRMARLTFYALTYRNDKGVCFYNGWSDRVRSRRPQEVFYGRRLRRMSLPASNTSHVHCSLIYPSAPSSLTEPYCRPAPSYYTFIISVLILAHIQKVTLAAPCVRW